MHAVVSAASATGVMPTAECERGFNMNQAKTACIRSQKTGTVEVCPAGSIEVGGECVIAEPKSARFACADGYNLDGDKCVK